MLDANIAVQIYHGHRQPTKQELINCIDWQYQEMRREQGNGKAADKKRIARLNANAMRMKQLVKNL